MLLVYVTAPSEEEADKLATLAVEQRLAAGVNVIPGMRSVYRWQGRVERAKEVVCIFKTTEERFPQLQTALLAAHSYETPCIVALPITHSTDDFAAWVEEQCLPLH